MNGRHINCNRHNQVCVNICSQILLSFSSSDVVLVSEYPSFEIILQLIGNLSEQKLSGTSKRLLHSSSLTVIW